MLATWRLPYYTTLLAMWRSPSVELAVGKVRDTKLVIQELRLDTSVDETVNFVVHPDIFLR